MYNNSQQHEDSLESENMRKLFAGSLDRTTSDETFTNYFSQFGEVLSSGIIRDPNTKESRGCGFVTYASSDIIEEILKSRPHSIDNKTVDVKRAIPKEFEGDAARTKTNRLFVGGFKGSNLTPEELQQYIESRHPTKFGTVDNVDFLKDRNTGELKGFGFITCSTFDFADRLSIAENSFSLNGKRMSIKKAEERDASQQRGGGMSRGGGPMRGGPRGGSGGGMRGGRGGAGGRGRGRGGRGGRGGGGYSNSYGGGYSDGGRYSNDGYNQDNSYYQDDNFYGGDQNNSFYQQDNSYRGAGGYGRESNWNRGSARYQPY